MIRKIILSSIIAILCAGSSYADTIIEYTLNGGGWSYEAENPVTLTLSDNPSGGVAAVINVPSYISGGGLTASKHGLPGFNLDSETFIELSYNSLTSVVSGDSALLSLCIELEFIDTDLSSSSIAMAIGKRNGSWAYVTWFKKDGDGSFNFSYDEPIPPGKSINEGALGLYFHGNFVSAYFKDAKNNISYPFTDWDISQINGPNSFEVDNDFEADTSMGGTVSGSIVLKHVVYGVGSPYESPKSSPWIPLLLLDE
jgi:hypothetical protein